MAHGAKVGAAVVRGANRTTIHATADAAKFPVSDIVDALRG